MYKLFNKVSLLFTLLFFCFNMFAQTNAVSFGIKNAGFTVNGFFEKYTTDIVYNSADVTKSQFNGEISTSSINTDNKSRDKHLRAADYFDVEKYPTITFNSTSVVSKGQGKLSVTGNLKIKNVSKKVTFDVSVKQVGGKNEFTGSLPINRRDFGVGDKSFMLSDNLIIKLKIVK